MKEQIGQRLKETVANKGISNVDIMKQANISKNVLSNYYKGEIPKNIMSLAKISQILGVSLDYIIFGKEHTHASISDEQIKSLLQYYNQLNDMNKKLAISELKHMHEVQELKKQRD